MKICLLGTVRHVEQPPYEDDSWKIWVCAPGNLGIPKRYDTWFELHNVPLSHFKKDYQEFLQTQDKPLYVHDTLKNVSDKAQRFDFEKHIERFGDKFFSSSISWMMAEAITRIESFPEDEEKKLAIYGVDMGHGTEYADQRWGCWHFIEVARSLGIEIVLPNVSKLRRTPRVYAYKSHSPLELATVERLEGARKQKAQLIKERNALNAQINVYEGAETVLLDILRSDFGRLTD